MLFDPDRCRSLLFVPAGNDRYLESALKGYADVIQIDLEDAIAPEHKSDARERVGDAIARVHDAGRVVSVRVNADDSLSEDLSAVVGPNLSALTVPKLETAAGLQELDRLVSDLERKRGVDNGQIKLIAQIESARGILNSREIAASTPRLAAMGIGMEDLSADIGSVVTEDTLQFPNTQVLYAAREAGVVPIGYPGSITIYKELDLFRGWIQTAKQHGFEGGFCIHPNQVEILNQELRPSEDEVQAADEIVKAAQNHSGAFSLDGRMIDAPVVARARRVCERHRLFS